MTPEDEVEETAAEHQFLIDDIEKATKRAEKAKFLEAAKEFADNCYPLMQAGFEHFGERMARLEATMDALIDGTDSLIQPELADQILATLEVGRTLAEEVSKLAPGTLDETTAKRLRDQASAYIGACDLTAEAVEEHTGAEDNSEKPEGESDE